MNLYEGTEEKRYKVDELMLDDAISRRLAAMGINKGTLIMITGRKHNGAMVIRVRGTRLAIGKHIAECIEVNEYE